MSKHLYILCEGELDEVFYERLAERVTGQTFLIDQELRYRPGANWKTVFASARLLINRFKHFTAKQDIGVIIAVDNDRASGHPAGRAYPRPLSKADQNKEPRHAKLMDMLRSALGVDRHTWPVEVALAVPVEMIESWVLVLLDPSQQDLPPFAEASSHSAGLYYAGMSPPPQLKDLCEAEADARKVSKQDLFWMAVEKPLKAACEASGSFKLFVSDLETWTSTGE